MSAEAWGNDERGTTVPAAEVSDRKAGKAGWLEILKHPLVLLVVGALLSNYLIPNWTRQWQDRQAELEIKVALINSIDEAITQMVMSVQYAVLGSASQSQEDYDEAYRRWEVNRHIIRSRLQAYYPGSKLLEDWEALSAEVTEFYAKSGTQDADERQEYLENWVERRDSLFQKKDELNRLILATPIPTFR